MVSAPRQKEDIGKITATFLLARNDHGCEEDGSSLCGMPERELMKRGKAPLVSPPVITTPFQRIAFNIVGPLPMTARLIMMDMATKFPDAIPIRSGDAVTVVEGMQKFFSFVGFPQEILTDRGAALMREVNKRLGIHHLKATPYHPESNGMLERWHLL